MKLKRKQVLLKHLKQLEKQEESLFETKDKSFIMNRINPVLTKVQDKIPAKLKTTLDTAFYKGFQLVFDKGSTYIEKTYNKDKIQLEYDLNNYAVDKYASRKLIRRLDKQSNLSKLMNSSIAVIEGGVLGLLGVGLPDIPLFIAVILRTLNEIALSYGFRYDTEEEKAYLLTLICGALSQEGLQRQYSGKADTLSAAIDSGIVTEMDQIALMRETADLLSDTLLTAKFIQGIPFVGAIGGVVNHTVITKISRYARLKYKKRYLQGKLKLQ
jgi:hypothetical protein